MVDNVTLNSGTGGAVVATDDVAGVHYPIQKLAFGALDSANLVTSTATNPLPVALSDTDNAVLDTIDAVLDLINAKLVSGTVIGDVNLGATDNAVLDSIQTAVQLLDDAVYTDDADWTALTSKHGLIGGIYQSTPGTITDGDTGPARMTANGALHVATQGTVTVDGSGVTQPVSAASLPLPSGAATSANQIALIGYVDGVETLLGTIDADTSVLAGAVAGNEMQVDVVAPLPAGTNAIGKLAANSGVDIGDVDVLSVPQGTSHYRNIDANAEAAIKGSAGTLYWLHVMNLTAAKAYLHLYDATTANVTPGTTTPDFTFPIPTMGDTNGAGFNLSLGGGGQKFANAITLVVTTTIDGSAGDPGTNGVFVNAGYA